MYCLICDNCDQKIGPDSRYYHIDMEGPVTLSDDRTARDFCSKKCIAEFYAKAAEDTN